MAKKATDAMYAKPVSVKVIVPKFGKYKKGDIIKPMFRSTANACVKSGKVEILEEIPNPKKAKK